MPLQGNSHSHVLLTRNVSTFKSTPSALAPLITDFFTLLQDPASENLRQAFDVCLAPNHLKKNRDSLGSDDSDAENTPNQRIWSYLEQPPIIGLLQGSASVANVLAPLSKRVSKTESLSSTLSMASSSPRPSTCGSMTSFETFGSTKTWTGSLSVSELENVVFMPYSVHSSLEEELKENRPDAVADWKLFAISWIIIECAHWLYEREHGHTPRPANAEILCKADVGRKVLARLLGSSYEFLTFADGNSKLIKLRLPAAHPPLLTSSILSSLFKASQAPSPFDATAFGGAIVNTNPAWNKGSFPVIKVLGPGSVCHHGITKV